MINSISKIIFVISLILGRVITISSSSWLGIWIGLEINLLSFIPLIIDNKNILYSESAIKYFLIQTIASLIFLFSSIFYIIKFNFYFNLEKLGYENFIITRAIIIKLGAAPLHFWFPNIIEGLSWNNTLIMLTWQKIAPLIILSIIHLNNFFNFFIIISSLVGSIGGINQISLKKILTYSSINHISWILLANIINDILWSFYLIIYLLINYSLIKIFEIYNLTNINQLFIFKSNFPIIKFCFLVNILSLGGLPPFLGFFPKWMIAENLILNNRLFILFVLIISTLITLYFYARVTFSAFLFSYPNFSWNKFFINNDSLITKNLIINFFIIASFTIFCLNTFFVI